MLEQPNAAPNFLALRFLELLHLLTLVLSAPSLLSLRLRVTTDVLDGCTYVAWCHAAVALSPNYRAMVTGHKACKLSRG
jgi:hypothetical protein